MKMCTQAYIHGAAQKKVKFESYFDFDKLFQYEEFLGMHIINQTFNNVNNFFVEQI